MNFLDSSDSDNENFVLNNYQLKVNFPENNNKKINHNFEDFEINKIQTLDIQYIEENNKELIIKIPEKTNKFNPRKIKIIEKNNEIIENNNKNNEIIENNNNNNEIIENNNKNNEIIEKNNEIIENNNENNEIIENNNKNNEIIENNNKNNIENLLNLNNYNKFIIYSKTNFTFKGFRTYFYIKNDFEILYSMKMKGSPIDSTYFIDNGSETHLSSKTHNSILIIANQLRDFSLRENSIVGSELLTIRYFYPIKNNIYFYNLKNKQNIILIGKWINDKILEFSKQNKNKKWIILNYLNKSTIELKCLSIIDSLRCFSIGISFLIGEKKSK